MAKITAQNAEKASELDLEEKDETGICIPSEIEEPTSIPALEAETPELDPLKIVQKSFLKRNKSTKKQKNYLTVWEKETWHKLIKPIR